MSDQDSQILLINKQTLTDIANAIRVKTGKTDKIYPSNMDEEILSITTGSDESHPPITVNITQSEHQTITANSKPNLNVTNGKIICPDSITINASITADDGYTPGTLNQTSVVANWGDTVSFSASPATEVIEGILIASIEYKFGVDNLLQIYINFTAENGSVNKDVDFLVDGSRSNRYTVELNSGETRRENCGNHAITEADILAGQITFDVVDHNDNSIVYDSLIIDDLDSPNGELTVRFSAEPTEDVAFEDQIYTNLDIENTGNLTITDIQFTLNGVDGNNTLNYDIYQLTPGEHYTDRWDYTVSEKDMDNGTIEFELNGSGISPDPDNPDISFSDSITVTTEEAASEMSITLSADPTNNVAEGDTVEFSGIIQNIGNVTITDIRLISDYTSDFDTLGDISLTTGETYDFTYEYTVSQEDINNGEIYHTISASGTAIRGDNPPDVSAVATVTTEEAVPHISISYTVTSSPENGNQYALGELIELDVTITNDGNVSLHNLTYGSELTNDESHLPLLAVGDSVNVTNSSYYTYYISEAEILAGECVIDLYANAYDPQDTLHNFSNDCTITNIESPNGELTLTMTEISSPADATAGYKPGEIAEFTANAQNTGNLTLTNIEANCDLSGDSYLITELRPGDIRTLNPNPNYTVTTGDEGDTIIVITATATSSDPDKPDPTVIPAETTFVCAQ